MFSLKNSTLFFCLAIGVFLATAAKSQPAGFIYLQSENNTSFQLLWNGNSYPSSSTGYLVVPQMPAGNQIIEISFPGTIWNNSAFAITLTGQPRGFSLRQTVQNQWVLFDMISFSQITGKEILPPARPKPVYEELVSPLAVKITAVSPAQKGPEPAPVKKETPPLARVRIPATTAIRKIFDKGGSAGIDQVYVIMTGSHADTIALFIPVLQQEIRQTARLGFSEKGKAPRAVKPGSPMNRSLFLMPETLFLN
jgi:hypothetical protein